MAKKDRTGNRKSREQRKQFKVPELGYYLIVTDTEATERCYFTGLHQALPEDVRNKLVIKVVETKTRTMIDKCLELTAYDAQYRIPWIVFDRDQVQGFDEIVAEAVSKGIQVGWSNPCFEIWMYAYFGAMPAIQDSWTCCSDFGRVYETKTGQKYSKADEQMYGKLCKSGDEEKAIQIAQQKLEQCSREGKTKPCYSYNPIEKKKGGSKENNPHNIFDCFTRTIVCDGKGIQNQEEFLKRLQFDDIKEIFDKCCFLSQDEHLQFLKTTKKSKVEALSFLFDVPDIWKKKQESVYEQLDILSNKKKKTCYLKKLENEREEKAGEIEGLNAAIQKCNKESNVVYRLCETGNFYKRDTRFFVKKRI